jgi:hypothetical protein
MTTESRTVDPALIELLDPLEQVIARAFIHEGKWKLADTDQNPEVLKDD